MSKKRTKRQRKLLTLKIPYVLILMSTQIFSSKNVGGHEDQNKGIFSVKNLRCLFVRFLLISPRGFVQ